MVSNKSNQIKLVDAFRFIPTVQVAIVGAGGKTSTMFQLAEELLVTRKNVLLSTTTHLSKYQANLANHHLIVNEEKHLPEHFPSGVTLVTGNWDEATDRWQGISIPLIVQLSDTARRLGIPFIIEADGARQLPLKAPANHEPVIPDCVDAVIVTAGINALKKPLSSQWVHRPQIFTELSGLKLNAIISNEHLVKVLSHPHGGLKGIPPHCRRICLLTHADTLDSQASSTRISQSLMDTYSSVVVVKKELSDHTQVARNTFTFKNDQDQIRHPYQVIAVHEAIAGIILAAGASQRFGEPKQLLIWEGETLIHRTARIAHQAGIKPIIVVCGAEKEKIIEAVQDLPVQIVHNPNWQLGQSSSVQAGVSALPTDVGGAIFFLVDQPFITPPLIRLLINHHSHTLANIVAPLVDGQRGNPVLFDRVTFFDLSNLQGDTGGRALFSFYQVEWLPWHDARLLFDIDTPNDYQRLLESDVP